MTVTLTMDTVLSRVRLTATDLGSADVVSVERSTDLVRWTTVRGGAAMPVTTVATITDTFGTASVDSWAPADTGEAWTTTGGAAGDYDKAAGVGTIALPDTAASRNALIGSAALTDVEVRTTFTVPATATGDSYNGFAYARRVDGNNHYALRAAADTTGNIDVEISRRLGGVTTAIASAANALTYAPGNVIGLAFRVVGSILQGKVWNATTGVEPGAWTVTATDTSLAAGQVGVRAERNGANTNVGLVLAFDNFSAATMGVRLDDYEFAPAVVNTYRVRGIESGAITFVGVGASATANNASVTPALPTGLAVGDAMVAFASIRNSGAGSVNVPAGWSVIRSFGNVALIGRKYVAGVAAPTITFAGGVANADTIGRIAAWRRASITPVTGNDQLNGSAQNIGYPLLTVPVDRALIIVAGWKQDDFTSVATLAAPFAEIGETSTTTGDDASQVWDYQVQADKADITAGSFVVTGGAAAISRGAVVALPHADYLNEQTATITPTLDRIWLKSVARPFLNRAVTVVDWSDVARPARSSVNDAVGRSLPIAVTDVRGSRRYTLSIYARTHEDAQTLDFILASGDVLFIHIPPGCEVPGGYVRVDQTSERRPHKRASSRIFALPVIECAAPGPDVVGVTATWDSILAGYPTWDAILAAFPTWDALLDFHGSPSEVIVS